MFLYKACRPSERFRFGREAYTVATRSFVKRVLELAGHHLVHMPPGRALRAVRGEVKSYLPH